MVVSYTHVRFFRYYQNISHMHLFMKVILHKKSEYCCATIDNVSHAPICVLEEKDRKTKNALNNVLRFFWMNFYSGVYLQIFY